ncbi:unnamed protein product [Orchesella dallaii]|uniref:Cytochrome P450 n=1 Tax=Orchesella dallaii TaxID=48710 RepID=A0ABP1RTF5_9HEXA
MELSNMRNLNSSTEFLGEEEFSTRKSSYLVSAFLCLIIFQILSKLVFQKGRNREQDGKRAVGLEVIRGPKPFFISFIGNAFDFLPLSETLNKVLTWHNLYGPCIRAIGVKRSGLVVFSAEMAQSFLKSGDLGHISKNGMPFYDIMKPFLGNGLVIAEGLHWQSRRKVVMRSLSFQTLRTFTKLLNKHSKRFVTSLEKVFEDNDVHQINVQINCSFLAIITEILTGIDMGDDDKNEVAEYHHDFQTWKKCLIVRTEKPWCLLDPFWKWHPMYPVHNDTVASLNAFAIRVRKILAVQIKFGRNILFQ